MTDGVAPPLVLDLDDSVGPLPGRVTVPLAPWQEAVRFGCTLATMRRFRAALEAQMPARYGTVFTGSGDFHHLSWPLITRLKPAAPIQVVVLDNHPDNMRYPFGVHCGSWVRRVALLPFVAHMHVLGITSGDIGARHAWENYLAPLRRGKLTYWSMGVDTAWSRRLGIARAFRNFATPDELVAAFAESQRTQALRSYLSIDKDVFAADVAQTNWDQGRFQLRHALGVVDSLNGALVGSDINGEVSYYRYRAWWKRKLSALDEQPAIDPAKLAGWHAQQHALNLALLAAIADHDRS